jgi:hypothetical protein
MSTITRRPIVAAPLSFTGSTERIIGRGLMPASRGMWDWLPAGPPWARVLAGAGIATGIGLVWLLGAYLLLAVWFAVACWYVIIFGVFGLFVIPWRIFRRGQRRRDAQMNALIAATRR